MRRYRTIAAALILLAAAGLSSQSMGQGGCVSRGEGQQMVDRGEVAKLPDALQAAGLSGVQVIEVNLCRSGGGWAYRVRYRHEGQVSTASIPAG